MTTAVKSEDKPIKCPHCGSYWIEPYGVSAYRCRNCLVVFPKSDTVRSEK